MSIGSSIIQFELVRNLRKDCVLLKPDKGNGLVVIDRDMYISALELLFSDVTKFKRIKNDPTLVRLSSIQSFINTLHKRGEISDDEKKLMRPKSAVLARAHGLPKLTNLLTLFLNSGP